MSSPEGPSRPPNPGSDDRGAATVLAAIVIAAILAVAMGGTAVGAFVVARHRAQSAADLAALAAATTVPAGVGAACMQAQTVATAMRATLRDCDIDGLDVTVVVEVSTGLILGGDTRAAARAGPIDSG